MASPVSVTHWIGQLHAGDRDAAQKLWEAYYRRLVGLAPKKLRGANVRTADEEDVALSAIDSFFRVAERGRFPQLGDRKDLWRLLVVITARKAIDLVHREGRQKRGGNALLGESALLGAAAGPVEAKGGMDQVIGREPTPEFAAQVAEECERLLNGLGDALLRSIALWKMEGDTTEDIAVKLRCVPRTVERKLHRIRDLWRRESAS